MRKYYIYDTSSYHTPGHITNTVQNLFFTLTCEQPQVFLYFDNTLRMRNMSPMDTYALKLFQLPN